MRLPLRHRPPRQESPLRRCAHLDALVAASIGLPLGAAASLLSSPRSRGRHGNALQWHLGLDAHDGDSTLDWEDRIEIKLVSVWARGKTGQLGVGCDKLKVCDSAIDPWHKLANVMWVFADRLTRVVVGAAQTHLAGELLQGLATSWHADPHFDHPALFVEAREHQGKRAPAYYLGAKWFAEAGLLPAAKPEIFPFDSNWWNRVREGGARDPWLSIVNSTDTISCSRCGGPISFEPCVLSDQGWAPARHGMPVAGPCALRGHVAIDGRRLRTNRSQSPAEFRAALESRVTRAELWRLADRVAEPDDHLHG